MTSFCRTCGDDVQPGRSLLGYSTCLPCGDEEAKARKFTVMPAYSKGAYQLDRKSTRLNSSHSQQSRMPSSA